MKQQHFSTQIFINTHIPLNNPACELLDQKYCTKQMQDTSTAKANFLSLSLLLRRILQNSTQKPHNDDPTSLYLPRIIFQVIKQCSSKSDTNCSYPTWIWLKILRGFGQKLCYSFISNINFLERKSKSTMNIKNTQKGKGNYKKSVIVKAETGSNIVNFQHNS